MILPVRRSAAADGTDEEERAEVQRLGSGGLCLHLGSGPVSSGELGQSIVVGQQASSALRGRG
jgi:hypothetical protein